MILAKKNYPCAVCGSEQFSPLYKVKDFAIVACKSCGFVAVNPRVENEQLHLLYTDKYFSGASENYGYQDYDLTANLRILTFSKWLERIRPFLSATKGPVLDIGCASGYFIDLMQQEGWPVEAIELDQAMVVKLRERGLQIFDRPFEDFVSAKKYKSITLFDVMEHIPDLQTTFKKLHDLLDEDGVVAMITPNFGSRQRKIFGKRWFQFKPLEHIHYFTPATLDLIAQKNGLEVVWCGASGQYADMGFLLNRLEKYRFYRLKALIGGCAKLLGLSKATLYLDTGSLFAVLRKRR